MALKTQPEGEIFGRRLRELRLERNLTQDALAQIVATSKPFISDMERGVKVPSLTMILRLAGALECRVRDLIDIFDAKRPAAKIKKKP
jgi:transcriptional regulator with XRE-family HTH domain